MASPKTLCLIDAHSIIHRAFHALPELATRSGQPTGAVFGFLRMLLKVLKERSPDLTAVVYDAKGPTFRHRLDPNYKANRPPMDPNLASQLPLIKDLVGALGLRQVEEPEVEADDVIATLAGRAAAAGREVVIVSGDKDLLQCLGPGVVMWDTMRDTVTGQGQVEERYGVGPARLADLFGLIGDTSDNIPGVPGIGPKTAGQLIQEFGDLETLLDRAGEIKQPKRRQNLIEFADQARLSKRLFTLKRDLDLGLPLEKLAPGRPDQAGLAEILTRLEMTSLLKELAGGEASAEPAGPVEPVEWRLVEGQAGLKALLGKAREQGRLALALDLEGGSPLRGRLRGLGLAAADLALELPAEGADFRAAAELLADPKVAKIGLDLKAAWLALKRAGLDLAGLDFDLLVADYLLYPGRRTPDLASLVREHLGREEAGAGPGAAAHLAWVLSGVLAEKLEADQLDEVFRTIETPLVPVLAGMEWAGVGVDLEELARISADLAGRLEELARQIEDAAGEEFNPNSPQQLGRILFDKLQLPTARKTKKKTGYSTSVEVLEDLRHLHPLPGLILDHRQLVKLKSTYVDALAGLVNPETGRIHTTFNQTVTATGRLSSSDPNLQNIPIRSPEGRLIRRAFVARPGRRLLSADYSQIELRILAHYSGDEALVEAFRRGEDIHTQTAAQVFGVHPGLVDAELRRQAKVINFGLIYGMTAYGLSQGLRVTPGEADKFIKAYFKRFSGVKRFWDQAIAAARRQGYVTTLWGRRRYLPDLKNPNQTKRNLSERMAINTMFQGSAADLIKLAMIKLQEALTRQGLAARMILQVHDELVLEVEDGAVEEASRLVREVMETAAELKVPLKVGLAHGANWDEAH